LIGRRRGDRITENGALKTFQTDCLPGRLATVAGRTYRWASGTDYLGLAHCPQYRRALAEGIERYGTHFGSSRNNTLRLRIFEDLETDLAAYCGAPAALTTSSGLGAGQTLLRYLRQSRPDAVVLYAPGVHPALWGEDYQPTPGPLPDWLAELPRRVAALAPRPVLVCLDSVGSPHTARVPLGALREVPENALVLVDDSHGLGLLGPDGRGSYADLLPLGARVYVVSSLNKALGTPAGLILGPTAELAALRRYPLFSGASPLPPAYAYALRQVLPDLPARHAALQAGIRTFVEALGEAVAGFAWLNGYPAFTTATPGLHEHLLAADILTACFPYPGPTDPAITRLVVTPLHLPADLRYLAESCRAFFLNR
jgi:8-amino-7-oxononanoate synthase